MTKHDKDRIAYHWIAEFSDGTTIKQFVGKDDTEISYKEVLDKMDLLEVFTITNDKEDYIADLTKNTLKTPQKTYKLKGKNPKLIYKRRNKVQLDMSTGSELNAKVTHIIGIDTDNEDQWIEVCAPQGVRPKSEKHDKKEKLEKKSKK